MTVKTSLRIHPSIGIARVGNSKDYYLGPETMAGMPQAGTKITGGLPIKKNTESTTISSEDLRENGRLKKQAARFKIFQYQTEGSFSYPSGGGTEVTLGSMVDGKKVTDIIWTVHLANKKANCWVDAGLDAFNENEVPNRPAIRNMNFPNSQNPADKNRLQKLVIDAGPRAISAKARTQIAFDKITDACYWDAQNITPLPNYPKSFPAPDGGVTTHDSASQSIDYLGEMITEENGRLIVLGGFGKACGFDNQGKANPNADLPHDVNNDNWFDDTSDGPVTAVLIFEDGSNLPLEGSAWFVATDPGYAPQVLNAVSVWDDVLATWVEKFGLCPDVFDKKYQDDYKPSFDDDVLPLLRAAALQRWTTNLPSHAINAHEKMTRLTSAIPSFDFLSFIRKPNDSDDPNAESNAPHMPLSLGDIGKSFLTITTTQYFFLEQWVKGKCENTKKELGAGELLDKTVLFNCLGGRFSPGIDLTYIVRDTHLYNQDWTNPAIGPFRINREKLDYSKANKETPFLGVGYIPLHADPIQPGDICKFMAIPWHTDYNSCAVHLPSPNPDGDIAKNGSNIYSGVNTTLFWSWPAQRPVAVYTYEDVVSNSGTLPDTQHYSVRGKGTATTKAAEVGKFQTRRDILIHWDKIGVVIQGVAIDGYPENYNPDYYLEVQSLFKEDESNLVDSWPTTVTSKTYSPLKK